MESNNSHTPVGMLTVNPCAHTLAMYVYTMSSCVLCFQLQCYRLFKIGPVQFGFIVVVH